MVEGGEGREGRDVAVLLLWARPFVIFIFALFEHIIFCLIHSFRTVAMEIICCCYKKNESAYADINQWPVALIQRMPSDEESYTRRIHSYQATPFRSRSTALEQTALNHGVLRETSV